MAYIEEAQVVIVGGGPVGTLLGLLLARNHKIKTTILEKDTAISQDPRAITLASDGIRCLQAAGLYDKVYTEIGTALGRCHFVTGRRQDMTKKPMLDMLVDTTDHTGHTLSIFFSQPKMEALMRKELAECRESSLRTGAEVVGLEESGDWVEVRYTQEGQEKVIRAKYVVGTDGRRGFVRKKYLEHKGIVSEPVNDLVVNYCGMNWDVTMPTPKSHPDFSLWKQGYSPRQVLDAFMPGDFKFFCNPDRNAVMFRLGVVGEEGLLWRTEFEVRPGEDSDVMARQEEVVKLVKPFMTHPGDRYGLQEDVTFPEDCLKPRRSWMYKFESKMCNRWWAGRVLLAGDAAHVFPPYGGQGVTQGFLDAFNLSWRLTAMLEEPKSNAKPLFDAYQEERKTNVKQSLEYTYGMRDIFEERNPVKLIIREVMLWLLQLLPFMRRKMQKLPIVPPRYEYADGMSFLPKLGGGTTFYQCYCKKLEKKSHVVFSDDVIFSNPKAIFNLVVLSDTVEAAVEADKELSDVVSGKSMIIKPATHIINNLHAERTTTSGNLKICRIATAADFADSSLSRGRSYPSQYDPWVLQKEYRSKRFILVRADRIVFAACKDTEELKVAMAAAERVFKGGVA